MQKIILYIFLATVFVTSGCSSLEPDQNEITKEPLNGNGQISTSSPATSLSPIETSTISPTSTPTNIPNKATIYDYISHEFEQLNMSQIERNDLWSYRLVYIVTSDKFIEGYQNREEYIIQNHFIQKYMLPYVSVQVDGEKRVLVHQAGDLDTLMLGPTPQEICEWAEWLYEEISLFGAVSTTDLADKGRVLGVDPYRINGDMPYCPNFVKYQPRFIQSTAVASMGLQSAADSTPIGSMGLPTSITSTTEPVKVGSAVISPENVSSIELLDWYSYGEVRDRFYLNDGKDRIGYSIVTFTNLVGYSLDGELLYELAAPVGPLYGKISSISGNHRYASVFSDESYSVDTFDLLTGEKLSTFNHLENFPLARFNQNERKISNVITAAFNQGGTLLAVAYEDKTISIWDTQTGIEYSLPRTFNRAYSMEFSQDSRYLIVYANKLSVFDISNIDNMELDYFGNVPNGKFPMISRDGDFLLFMSYSYNETPMVVDLNKRETVYDPELIEQIYPTIQEWNDHFGEEYGEISYDSTQFFPTTKLIPVGNSFQAWNQTYGFSEDNGDYYGLEYWSEGENYELVQFYVDGIDQSNGSDLWERIDATEDGVYFCRANELVRREIPKYYSVTILAENCDDAGVVAYDPVHDLIAYPVSNHLVEIISGETGRVVFQLRGFTKNLTTLKFSDDGNYIALVTHLPAAPGIINFNELMLFSLNHDTEELISVPLDLRSPVFEDYVKNIKISRDGSFLIASILSLDSKLSNKIDIWDFLGQYGAKVRSIPVENPDILALSPDASLLAVASPRTLTIKIYSMKTSELVTEIPNPRDANIDDLMFSADSKNLYVVIGGAIAIWGIQ